MTAEIERDRAAAARASSWTLWFLSLVAMGAVFATVADRDPLAWPLTAIMLLLAWSAGMEREEMREALVQAELLEIAAFDAWAEAWR